MLRVLLDLVLLAASLAPPAAAMVPPVTECVPHACVASYSWERCGEPNGSAVDDITVDAGVARVVADGSCGATREPNGTLDEWSSLRVGVESFARGYQFWGVEWRGDSFRVGNQTVGSDCGTVVFAPGSPPRDVGCPVGSPPTQWPAAGP